MAHVSAFSLSATSIRAGLPESHRRSLRGAARIGVRASAAVSSPGAVSLLSISILLRPRQAHDLSQAELEECANWIVSLQAIEHRRSA